MNMRKGVTIGGLVGLLFLLASIPSVSRAETLMIGAQSSAVSDLQQALIQTGDYPYGTVTGYFGAATQAAVQHFQCRMGIVCSGSPATTGFGAVGPTTGAAIKAAKNAPRVAPAPAVPTPTVRPQPTPSPTSSSLPLPRNLTIGSSGSDVVFLQKYLAQTGDYTYGEITGYFGSVTQAAVQRFQCRLNIICSGSAGTTGYGVAGPTTRQVVLQNPQQEVVVAPPPAASCVVGGSTIPTSGSKTFYSQPTVSSGESCATYSAVRTCTDGTLSGNPLYQYPSCSEPQSLECTFNGRTINSGGSVIAFQSSSVAADASCFSQIRECSNGVLSGTFQYPTCLTQAPVVPPPPAITWPPSFLANIPSGYLARVRAVFQGHLSTPFPSPTNTAGPINWGYLNYALASLTLGQDIEQANKYLEQFDISNLTAGQISGDEDLPDTSSANLTLATVARVYELFNDKSNYMPGRLTRAAQTHLEAEMWRYTKKWSKVADAQAPRVPWSNNGSENIAIQTNEFLLLASQELQGIAPYRTMTYEDGQTPAAHYAAWKQYFSLYLDELAKKGLFVETGSPGYEKYTLPAIFNLYNFVDDTVVRTKAEMLLDLFFADFGQEQFQYIRGGGKSRSYIGINSTFMRGNSVVPAVSEVYQYERLMFDPSYASPSVSQNIQDFATSNYYPPAVVEDITQDVVGRGVYAIAARRPGVTTSGIAGIDSSKSVFKYSFATPSYMIGAIIANPADSYDAASEQNRWEGITFNGDVGARIYPQLATGETTPKSYNNFYTVQDRNVLITAKNPNAIVQPSTDVTAPFTYLYFSSSLDQLDEEQGWIFVQEGSAYAAVRVVQSGYAWLTAQKNHNTDPNANFIKLNTPLSPIVMVVNQASDYGGSFAAFKAAVTAQPVTYKNGVTSFSTLTFYGATQLGKINGAPLAVAPARVYDSPFIRSNWNSGLIYIRKGSLCEKLDFTNSNNPQKISGTCPSSDPNYPPGVGSAQPIIFSNHAASLFFLIQSQLAGALAAVLDTLGSLIGN